MADDQLVANSDSFWEVENYKQTVKRIEDGFQNCNEIMRCIQERSEIEKEYSKRLKHYSKKWNEFYDKGTEIGTTKIIIKSMLDEAEQMADIHITIKDKLLNEPYTILRDWIKENYNKSMMGMCKEAKSFDEDFKKVQKPWLKRLTKVMKAKKEYYTTKRLLNTSVNQEQNAKNCSDISNDNLRRCHDKIEKCNRDVITAREKYEHSLNELNEYKPRYYKEMSDVFAKCQELEMLRMKQIKRSLSSFGQSVDITKYLPVTDIYEKLYKGLNDWDMDADLKWWSDNHGTSMYMQWPTFEEYITEFHSITNKPVKNGSAEGIMLTGVVRSINENEGLRKISLLNNTNSPSEKCSINAAENKKNVLTFADSFSFLTSVQDPDYSNHSLLPQPQPESQLGFNNLTQSESSIQSTVQPELKSSTQPSSILSNQLVFQPTVPAAFQSIPAIQSATQRISLPKVQTNVQSEFQSFDQSKTKLGEQPMTYPVVQPTAQYVETPFIAVMVQALYDYIGQESDELSFKQGDILLKLRNRDEQGWCFGQMGEKCGLYPDNYVQPI